MKHLILLFALSSIFEISHETLGNTFYKIRQLVEHERELKYKNQGFNEVQGFAFNQRLDHFEVRTGNLRVFSQRYWRNAAYWRKPDGPVFLYIGGEGALSGAEISGGHIVDMAKKYGALLFAVEHRFYGRSIFAECFKDKNMGLLSSQQALADLSIFIKYASNKFGLTNKNKWISYGGSYPGSLSAWFRIKYPHLVIGAVASSAPVQATVNFEAYNDVVAASLNSKLVGGSEQCVDKVKSAFKQIEEYITEKNFSQLQEDFNSCNDISNTNDSWMFAVNLASFVMGIVQYNRQTPGLDISTLCKYVTNSSGTPYLNFASLYTGYMKRFQRCNEFSYHNFILQLKNIDIDPSGLPMIRQWYFQTCTQFGYFQTCDPKTKCVFSKRVNLLSDLDICQEVFGVKPKSVQERVNFTNQYYGSNKPRGSKIIFINGSIDPWHALSVLKNLTSSEISIFIPGTSHCENMASDDFDDPPALKEARQKVSDIVGTWLEKAEQDN
ncbi:thymus-specific serine protease-like isoform X2 [Actinia tenebrosa]|uniref:Thymus-specific serine protease-like isoform X2 n=1 Tax=Actinia tenebrosa TaxID=6105 RepID=A0A6P8HE69_ACTTE|nr:thymus-specific serine protease-like isoform X2 [Actinia tenebrosa]